MQDIDIAALSRSVLWAAFALAVIFGAIAQRTHFCTMGAVSDILTMGDWSRMRMWVAAMGVAMIGFNTMAALGWVQAANTVYGGPRFIWLSALTGGALFGFGMVFGGGCATRNLVRVGGGDLRALLTLVILGIAAYVTMTGLLGPARQAIEQATSLALPTPTQSLSDLAAAVFKPRPGAAQLLVAALVIGVMLAFCLYDAKFRASPTHIASGVGVGLCIVAGWALTGLAFDELSDKPMAPASLTFVRPTGDTLEWLQRFTALGLPGFGVASVFGTILGAFLAAKASGRFRLVSFTDTPDTLRHLGGAVLMGIGGIMALGCTIGQGITGLSTLAAGAFLTLAGLIAGGLAGVRTLEAMLMRET